MCGIIGFFNFEGAEKKAKEGLQRIIYRGLDGNGYYSDKSCALGHCLHAINNHVSQPLEKNNHVFIANCEIYNWEELDKINNTKSRNDAESLFNHILTHKNEDINDILEQLDGVYAFALLDKEKNILTLARDIIGEKPIWYFHDETSRRFAFASEKKALVSQGIQARLITELNPRIIIRFDYKNNSLTEIQRPFFNITETRDDDELIQKKTEKLLTDSIRKRISNDNKIGLLFSGGLDCTLIALILKRLSIPFTLYTAAVNERGWRQSEDLEWSKKAAEELGGELKITEVKLSDIPPLLNEILPIIEDNNVVKAGVAMPIYLATKKAKEDGVRILFSGLGSEEIFGGYERHKNSQDLNEECLSGLRKTYERDLYRDDAITMHNTIELRLPFLDKNLVKYALTIPARLKMNEKENKIILRRIARKLGLSEELSARKKKAAQYGGNFDKALEKLSRKEKLSKSQYLKKFYDEGNVRLGALLSTGKDSILATQIMIEQNYEITCFITIESENKDSYMYHGPNTHLAKLQADAANKPIIIRKTRGEKEEELQDLKEAIKEAMDKYKIEGIVTGALFSNYQRKRIEKICDELGIKCISPLWHMDQKQELELLLKKGIEFMIVKVAAEGLDKSWLGRTLKKEDIEKLISLSEKHGMNPAGEGGEYESFVVNAPFFSRRIRINESEIITDGNNATLDIKDASIQSLNRHVQGLKAE